MIHRINVFQNGEDKIMYVEEKELDTSDHTYLRSRVHATDIRYGSQALPEISRKMRKSILTSGEGFIFDIVEKKDKVREFVVDTSTKEKR